MNKLIVILGATASGKTDLSIRLAKKYNGEVVSADSRQVYKGMDIGSGKITKKEMQGIPHYLLDVANPKTRFAVAQFQKLARIAIKKIQKKGKLPFLVGGTGFYIQSVVDGIVIPEVKPDWKLRKKLEKLTTEQLFKKLKKIDPRRAKTIDKQNPRRLIRALEIVLKTSKPVPPLLERRVFQCSVLEIGIKKSADELKKLIHKRLLKRLKPARNVSPASYAKRSFADSHSDAGGNNPLINEIKKLHKSGVSWKRLEEFGLEYRFVAQWIFCNIYKKNVAKYRCSFRCPFTYQKMIYKIQKESEHYTKKQATWFKRDKRIKWIKNYKKAEKLVKNFIKKQE